MVTNLAGLLAGEALALPRAQVYVNKLDAAYWLNETNGWHPLPASAALPTPGASCCFIRQLVSCAHLPRVAR